MFAIGASGVESYKVEKDVAMKPGGSFAIAGYDFKFVNATDVRGPNYDAVQGLIEVTRGGKPVTTLLPQKRHFLGAADQQQQGGHFGELGARFVRRHGRFVGRGCLEHAHSV